MPRSSKEVDIEARINGCFQRSMHGKVLDRESPEMSAIVAYMRWLSQNISKDKKVDIDNAGTIDT